MFSGIFPESQGRNQASTVLYVPHSLDSGVNTTRGDQVTEVPFVDRLRTHTLQKTILVQKSTPRAKVIVLAKLLTFAVNTHPKVNSHVHFRTKVDIFACGSQGRSGC